MGIEKGAKAISPFNGHLKPLNDLSIRVGEYDKVLVDITFSKGKVNGGTEGYGVSFRPKGVIPDFRYHEDPTSFNAAEFAAQLYKDGSATIRNISYRGGGAQLLEDRNGSTYLLLVRRDDKAPFYPSTLDITAGRGNSGDPRLALIGEAIEEVLFIDNKGRVIIPQFSEHGLEVYNEHVCKTVKGLAGMLSLEKDCRKDTVIADAKHAKMKSPFYLCGVPIGVGFSSSKEFDPENMLVSHVNIVLPPTYLPFHILNEHILGFKETIAYETGGDVPEREVVLVKISGSIDSPEVMLYKDEKMTGTYPSLAAYLKEVGIKTKTALTPDAETIINYLGLRPIDYDERYYIKPLTRLLREEKIRSSGGY